MSGPTAPRRLADTSREVADLANAVVHEATAAGRLDLADLISTSASRWADPQVSIVVAGEVGVGKTSLLNALIGRHGLLPAASEPTTGVITMVHGITGPDPVFEATVDDRDDPVPLDAGELAEWIGLSGQAGPSVAQVRVGVPEPLTGARLTFVDTPGVAGPHTIADRLVLAVLARADVLLFVLDPDAPVGQAELDFLTRAHRDVGACVVALSRIDRFRGWATMHADSSSILDREFGDWVTATVGVSSALAEVAEELRTEDPAAAAELDTESGLGELRAVLAALGQKAKYLRLRGLLLVVQRVLDEVSEPLLAAGRASEASADELTSQVAAIKAEHAELKARGSEALRGVGDGVSALREQMGIDLRRLVVELHAEHEDRLVTAKADPDSLLDALESDLRAAQIRFEEGLEARFTALGERLAAQLDAADAIDGETTPGPIGRRAPAEVAKEDFSLRLRMAAIMASAGGGTLMLVMGVTGTAGAQDWRSGLAGLSMVLGSIVSNSGVRQTRQHKVLQTVRTQAKEILDDWQATTLAAGRARLLGGQRDLETAVRSSVKDRLAELDHQVADLEAVARASAQDRRRLAVEARTIAERLTALDGRLVAQTRIVQDAIVGTLDRSPGPDGPLTAS